MFSVEKGAHQELGARVREVQTRIENLKKEIKQLDGVDQSEHEQQEYIAKLYEEIIRKNQAITAIKETGLLSD
jgi:uncharacterized protein YlxW (UPF0749 family)